MGEVWLAEQLEPVKRRVALKIIKPGMETKQVVARFEAERQALALMDHPAIAKVLDGGSTSEGRAYFVMEYIAGVRITDFCDVHRLTIEERLRLLIEVCGGVQHAHQKAVIHRDLKPSNILVTEVDGRAQPKIIDFGVAKAIAHRLTEKTLFTEVGFVVGTPEYMSPEQAELNVQDVDTRTDVYALGVILYELITGRLPFPSDELRSVSYDELRRRLREVEPPRPSVQARTDPDSTAAANKRGIADVSTLPRRLHGDLDAITMKALEKDRARRYGAASELAADLERHLRHEPVVARPASRMYKLRKYARRHALLLLGTGAVVASIAVGGVVATLSLVQARKARAEEARQRTLAEARLQAAEGYADKLFSDVAPRMDPLPGSTELRKRFIAESSDFLAKLGVGLNDDARLRWLTARLELSLATLETNFVHANSLEDYPSAIKHAEHVQALLGSLPAGFPSPLERSLFEIRAEYFLGIAIAMPLCNELALQHFERLRSLAEAIPSEPDRAGWIRSWVGRRGDCLNEMDRYAEAIPILRLWLKQAEAEHEKNPGERTTRFALQIAHGALSRALAGVNDLDGAIEHGETAVKLAKELQDPNWARSVFEVGFTSIDLGGLYLLARRFSAGEKLIDAGLERFSWLLEKDPSNEFARMFNARLLSEAGHRAFASAQLPGLSTHERRSLLLRATRSWKECAHLLGELAHPIPAAARGVWHLDCGGQDADKPLQLLSAAK
jgi:tetratricopeptide (TPR) repeat protein